MPAELQYKTVTIASGASLSPEVGMDGYHLIGIVMPAAWTAAAITFQGAADGATYNSVYDNNGTEVTVQASASRHIQLTPSLLSGLSAVKLRSGTAGVPVNQGADRVLGLVFRAY